MWRRCTLLCATAVVALSCRPKPAAKPEPKPAKPVAKPFVLAPMTVAPRKRLASELGDSVVPLAYQLDMTVDPAKPDFTGKVAIDVSLREPGSTIWLHSLGHDDISARVTQQGHTQQATLHRKHDLEQLGLQLPEPLAAGAARIEIEFRGTYNEMFGVFRRDDKYAFTQFQPTHARRAFPCFDEPRFKVPWTISVTAKDGDRAFSNYPAQSNTKLAGGQHRTVFATTRPLPSYLIALAVGPFEVIDIPGTSVPMRAIVRQGKSDDAGPAVRALPKILTPVEAFFGHKPVYPKIDFVAVPNMYFGGMENPGLITILEDSMAPDPNAPARYDHPTSKEMQRWAFWSTATHELAHLWFGDSVTIRWWDDLWLNEGLAVWLTEKLVSGYDARDSRRRVAEAEQRLLLATSIRHAGRTPAGIYGQMTTNRRRPGAKFWARWMSWRKAAVVMRMFEAWVGKRELRKAIRYYVSKHADGTVTTLDFATAIAESTKVDLRRAVLSYTSLPDIPLITVQKTCDKAGTTINLTQEPAAFAHRTARLDKQIWSIPICLRMPGGRPCFILSERKGRVRFPGESCPAWIHPNAGAAGFYRFRMPGKDLATLATRGVKRLTRQERLSLLDSVSAGVMGGDIEIGGALPVFAALAKIGDIDAEQEIAETLLELSAIVEPALQKQWATYIRSIFGNRARLVGVAPKTKSESARLLRLRPALVRLVGDFGGDKRLRQQARSVLRQNLASSETLDFRTFGALAALAARDSDRAFLEYLLAFLTPQRKTKARQASALLVPEALGALDDPVLLQEALAFAISNGGSAKYVLQSALANNRNGKRALAIYEKHYDELMGALNVEEVTRLVGGLDNVRPGRPLCSEADAVRLEAFVKPHLPDLNGWFSKSRTGAQTLQLALVQIRRCARLRAVHRVGLKRFLGGRR